MAGVYVAGGVLLPIKGADRCDRRSGTQPKTWEGERAWWLPACLKSLSSVRMGEDGLGHLKSMCQAPPKPVKEVGRSGGNPGKGGGKKKMGVGWVR